MGRINSSLLSFNRGECSKLALARVDLERMRLSAETQVNFQPTVLGPMMLRPGTQHVGGIRNDLASQYIPFIFSNNDLALLEFTASTLRIWNIDDDTETLVTRPSVFSLVVNGDFSSSSGWTLTATGSGASSAISGGKLTMSSPAAGGLAQAKRTISVGMSDINVEHGFRIVVDHGPVIFRVGSSDGADDYISETTLDTGTHSLACTPTGDMYLQIETITAQNKIVDSITFDTAGTLELPTSFAADDLTYMRPTQSGDIVFIACQGQQQSKIERRSTRSWSVVLYLSDDGPFQAPNITDITLTPSVLTGNGTLTASRNLFKTTHEGCLFRLFSDGQAATNALAAQNTFGGVIRVTGVGEDRRLTYAITGTFVGTLTLQRSLDSATSGFVDTATTATGAASGTVLDALDNSIAWYRWGFKTGNYTSGTATINLTYPLGGASGVCRVTSYSSATVANIEVLSALSSLTATSDWNEGDWSDKIGWPSSVAFHDGRLWFAGRDKIWASVSDAYTSFDIDTEGASGPINRSVGFGPVDIINWLLPLTRLIVGREGAETSIRSSAFDEPLTPTNFTLKDCSTQGSAPIGAVKIDTRGVFVQQSNRRVYELAFDGNIQDYAAHDLARLHPKIAGDGETAGFIDLAVQRQPDTQLHFVRGDGQVAALVHDAEDQVEAWWRIDSSGATGIVESVAILPGVPENRVYYAVKRTIGGSTKRFLEKLATRDQCTGLPEARLSDCHAVYTGGTTTVTGLTHLEGQGVVAWGWDDDGDTGSDCGTGLDSTGTMITLTVSGGTITIPQAFDNVCAGLPYTGQFKSAKLAYAAQMGTALNQKKKVNRIGLILANSHFQGLRFGQNFTRMDNMPLVHQGVTIASDTVHEDFDGPMTPLPGSWDTDSRLCLMAASPRPCMVMSAVVDVTTDDAP